MVLNDDADWLTSDAAPHYHELPGGAAAAAESGAADEEAAPVDEEATGSFGGRAKRSSLARWWDLKMDAICVGRI